MDRELERLKADRDAARGRLGDLATLRRADEGDTLRRRLGELEHQERRTSIINGGGAEAMRITSEKLVVAERLRQLDAVLAARNGEKAAAQSEVAAAQSALSRALSRRHDERVTAVVPQIEKAVEGCFKLLDSLEAQRIEDRREFGVSVDASEFPLHSALKVVWEGPLGQTPWLSPATRAEAEGIAKVAQERRRKENQPRYDAKKERLDDLVKRRKLSPDKRDAALAATREMLGMR